MLVVISAHAFRPEMRTVKMSDGETVTGRICLPDSGDVRTIVVVVHGTGPNTYLNKRPGFNFYDILADGFCEQGVAFYTYDRRGVYMGDKSPWFDTVDRVKFAKYTPLVDADDIETHIASIRKDKRFRNCKILLYGLSEGTITAAMVAERGKAKVDALLLHGYANENLYDIIRWQNLNPKGIEVGMGMILKPFDKDGDKAISREEFDAKGPNMDTCRVYFFQNMPFDLCDVTKDGVLDVKDVEFGRKERDKLIMNKIAEGDEEWLWSNYSRVTIPWLRAHFALEPNKTRLLRLDLPIHIFHGTDDMNVPVEGVYDIAERFRVCTKTNLETHIFEAHNHDLNFDPKETSVGLQKIFDTAANI